jgi:hypothetical protein
MKSYFCNACAVDGGGHALECPKRERATRAAKLQEMAALSRELDAESDKLNARILELENDLEDAQVRVWMWLEERLVVDDHEWRLGYRRLHRLSRVVAARRIGTGEPPLFDDAQPLGDTPRSVRVVLVPHLDKLLDALHERTQAILDDARRAVKS